MTNISELRPQKPFPKTCSFWSIQRFLNCPSLELLLLKLLIFLLLLVLSIMHILLLLLHLLLKLLIRLLLELLLLHPVSMACDG